jgi:hypothetical protein
MAGDPLMFLITMKRKPKVISLSKHDCPTKPIKTKSLSNKSSPKMVPRTAAAICLSMMSRIVSKLELSDHSKKGLSKPAVPTTKLGGHAFYG